MSALLHRARARLRLRTLTQLGDLELGHCANLGGGVAVGGQQDQTVGHGALRDATNAGQLRGRRDCPTPRSGDERVDRLRERERAIAVRTLLAPRAFGFGGAPVELFGTRTRPAFDELGAARTLAQMIVDGILQRERAARLVQQSVYGDRPLTLAETIDALIDGTWGGAAPASAKLSAVRRVTQRAVADRLLLLAADSNAAPEVRAMAEYKINELIPRARTQARAGSVEQRAHYASLVTDLTRWIDRRELPALSPALRPPPGDPFGEDIPW